MPSFKLDPAGLTLLVDILDAKSFAQAARNLNVTRANISSRLAQVERDCGVLLIRRTTRNLEPTEIGLEFYERGKRIREELTATEDSIRRLGQRLGGVVRLCVPTGYGQIVMTKWLLEFKRLYPDVVLSVLFENGVDDLMSKEIDVSVRITSAPPPNVVARELLRLQYVVCVSPGYELINALPSSVLELATMPMITSGFIGNNMKVKAKRGATEHEVTLHPHIISANFIFLREAILDGHGFGFLPSYMVDNDIRAGRLVLAFDDWSFSVYGDRIYIIRMPGRYQTAAMRTLIDFVISKAAEHQQDNLLKVQSR